MASNKIMLLGFIVLVLVVGAVAFTFLTGFFSLGAGQKGESTFIETDNEICTEQGKPVVRMFSTSWCPHCLWIKETFHSVTMEYVENGEIVAHHWILDWGDDSLTQEIEDSVPAEETAVWKEFNPRNTIPTFVFGCKYYRIGTGHERTGSDEELQQEEAEFRAVIEKLIEESKK